VTVASEKDLIALLRIGKIVGLTLQHMLQQVEPGMTTRELDKIGAAFLKQHGARSAPILAYDYPGHTCISINDEAAHGVPGDRVIQPGDLVNVDVSAELDGYWADTGATLPVPPVTPEMENLCAVARRALDEAIKVARAGQPINRVGKVVEKLARRNGYTTFHELGGHGVGRHIHEKPSVPNDYRKRLRDRFEEGMVLTIEPFINNGKGRIYTAGDKWTLKTVDGSLSAQYEHTVVITRDEPILVTAV